MTRTQKGKIGSPATSKPIGMAGTLPPVELNLSCDNGAKGPVLDQQGRVLCTSSHGPTRSLEGFCDKYGSLSSSQAAESHNSLPSPGISPERPVASSHLGSSSSIFHWVGIYIGRHLCQRLAFDTTGP